MTLRRLKLETAARHRFPVWPEQSDKQRGALFEGRAPYRKLTVLLDADLLSEAESRGWGTESLLAGLLTLELIDGLRYADDGRPDEVPRKEHEHLGTHVPGWVMLGTDNGDRIRKVRSSNAGLISSTAIVGELPDVAAADATTTAYSDRTPDQASEQRRRDAVALQVADAIGADLFLTARPYLHENQWGVAGGVTLVGVDDALAIVGLYLRAQGSYVTWRGVDGRGTSTMNRGLFYWVGTRELLPAAWRWFTACVQHSNGGGDDRLIFVGQSVLQRTQRAIQARDEMHIALNRAPDNDTAEDALVAMDILLLLLMGAVDATARVAHTTLGLTSPPHSSGWQRKPWRKEVREVAPDLADLFKTGSKHLHALTILRLLRNAIHGEALQPLAVGTGHRRVRTLVTLPHSDAAEVMKAIAALGGEAAWGVESLIPGRLHFDPGQLIDELFPRVLELLNCVMDDTPVERLSHVSLSPSDSLPPDEKTRDDTFGEMNRASIRWQLGL